MFGGGFEIGDFFLKEKTSVDWKVILDGISGSVGAMDDGETILDVEVGTSGIDN